MWNGIINDWDALNGISSLVVMMCVVVFHAREKTCQWDDRCEFLHAMNVMDITTTAKWQRCCCCTRRQKECVNCKYIIVTQREHTWKNVFSWMGFDWEWIIFLSIIMMSLFISLRFRLWVSYSFYCGDEGTVKTCKLIWPRRSGNNEDFLNFGSCAVLGKKSLQLEKQLRWRRVDH